MLKKFLLFNIFLTLYIGINLIGGERGLISYFDKKKLFKLNINYLLIEGGKELTKSLIHKKHINQFFLFKSGKNLNTNGQLRIKEIVNQLNKKFKNKMNLDVYLNKDKVINYS